MRHLPHPNKKEVNSILFEVLAALKKNNTQKIQQQYLFLASVYRFLSQTFSLSVNVALMNTAQ